MILLHPLVQRQCVSDQLSVVFLGLWLVGMLVQKSKKKKQIVRYAAVAYGHLNCKTLQSNPAFISDYEFENCLQIV